MKKLLVVLGLLATLPCMAANWVEIGYKLYLDTDSVITSDSGYSRGWTKLLIDQQDSQWVKVYGPEVKNIWYFTFLEEADCANKRLRILKSSTYDLKGRYYGPGEEASDFSYVAPDTYADMELTAICTAASYSKGE